MKKTGSAFNSILRADVTEKNSTQAESLAGISYLPRSRVEKIHAQKNLSPRSIQKKINTFIDETLKNDPLATSLVFEELCKRPFILIHPLLTFKLFFQRLTLAKSTERL